MAQFGTDVAEDLVLIEIKMKQLKNEYDQYFLGSRKREPHMLRGEVNKMVVTYTNRQLTNTGHRFKFSNLRSRYFTFKRLWDDTLRKIEEGRYERHLFKAKLHDRERNDSNERRNLTKARDTGPSESDLFDAYVTARTSTGQGAKGITRDKLTKVLAKQESAIRKKYGCEKVRFRVVVEAGKAKVKATPVSS
ncbi:MAG: hypothetical protein GY946_26095 [bacterium]|nr:hypothetical protein [bacterium]